MNGSAAAAYILLVPRKCLTQNAVTETGHSIINLRKKWKSITLCL